MTGAMEYLDKVKGRAKEMYALSDQGLWEDLHPDLQAFWIAAADEEIKNEQEGRRA